MVVINRFIVGAISQMVTGRRRMSLQRNWARKISSLLELVRKDFHCLTNSASCSDCPKVTTTPTSKPSCSGARDCFAGAQISAIYSLLGNIARDKRERGREADYYHITIRLGAQSTYEDLKSSGSIPFLLSELLESREGGGSSLADRAQPIMDVLAWRLVGYRIDFKPKW